MTHISRKRLKAPTLKLIDSAMSALFTALDTKGLVSALDTVLSKTEKEMLAKRIAIIMLLENGVGPKKISEITKTTMQTVLRIRLQLLEVSPKSRKFVAARLKRFMHQKAIAQIIVDILNSLPYPKKVLRDLAKGS